MSGRQGKAKKKETDIGAGVQDAEPPIDFRPLHTLDYRDWVPGDQLPEIFLKGVGERLGRTLSYAAPDNAQSPLGRLARRATQSWYLDFESTLFYFIAQALAWADASRAERVAAGALVTRPPRGLAAAHEVRHTLD